MNLKKYKPYKVLEVFSNKISEAYDIQIPKEIRKDRKKCELFIFEKYGSIRKNKDNISYIDDLTYGIKSILNILKLDSNEKEYSLSQYEEMKNYIYDNHFSEFNNIPEKVFSYKEILFEDILFVFLEFLYKSKIYSAKYNFDREDVRKTYIGRLELLTYNKIQDLKLNRLNFKPLFIDSLENYNYSLKEIISMTIEQKSTLYRTEFISSTFFYFEHVLKKIIKAHNIDTSKVRNKQQVLRVVLEYFEIEEKLDLKIVLDEVISRCNESSEQVKNLLIQENSFFKTKTEMFLKFVNIRNSLHDNGVSNKDEIEIKIGKVSFSKVNKGEHHQSMNIMQVIILEMILFFIFEEIIEKSYEKFSYIQDKWIKEKTKFDN